jgi:hypothetical protein
MLLAFRLFIVAAGLMTGHFEINELPPGVTIPVAQVREVAVDAGAYPIYNQWDEAAEKEYSAWVETIGKARERKVFRLTQGLRDPAVNPLYSPDDDKLRFDVDCAEFAYALRAYFAIKTNRPFSFVANKGRRYRYGNRPREFKDFSQYNNPYRLLRSALSAVSSGHFRMNAALEGTDTYPVDVTKDSIKPGIPFYNPNGHVLVVYKVDHLTGDVYLMDGHPDGTLTMKKFNPKMRSGSRRSGGGFRAWRHYHIIPLDQADGGFMISRELNAQAPHYNETIQYKLSYNVDGIELTYHEWVRSRLVDDAIPMDPLPAFDRRVVRICDMVSERTVLIEEARFDGWPEHPTLEAAPRRYYWGESGWHKLSTAVLDTQLREAVTELRQFSIAALRMAQRQDDRINFTGNSTDLFQAFESHWAEHENHPDCQVSYLDSAGQLKTLALSDLVHRLSDISFDPYHCPELRWGEGEGDLEELPEACLVDSRRIKRYRSQRNVRARSRLHLRPYVQPSWHPNPTDVVRTRQLLGSL